MGRNQTRQDIMWKKKGGEEFKCRVADVKDGRVADREWRTGSEEKILQKKSKKEV